MVKSRWVVDTKLKYPKKKRVRKSGNKHDDEMITRRIAEITKDIKEKWILLIITIIPLALSNNVWLWWKFLAQQCFWISTKFKNLNPDTDNCFSHYDTAEYLGLIVASLSLLWLNDFHINYLTVLYRILYSWNLKEKRLNITTYATY